MEKKGHEVIICAVDINIIIMLLCVYGFKYINLGNPGDSLIKKAMNVVLLDLKMYQKVKNLNPDIFLGIGSIRAAHVSFLLRKKCVSFEDTEHSTEQIKLYLPFTTAVFTPSCFQKDLGKKQVMYNGYHELAYLHPNYFTPNPSVLDEIGLTEEDTFIVLRFVSWRASHDIGQHGILDRIGMVKALEKYGRVLITSEGPLPPDLQSYNIRLSPEKLHDLLYYATLYVGEGGTMASEAAVLGTPSIYISSLAGSMGNFIELEETYDMLFSFTDGNVALDKAFDILRDPESKKKWSLKRKRLLEDKIDVTAFMIWFIENYPKASTDERKFIYSH